VLDLDETLIHCNENLSTPHDVTLKIRFPTGEKIDAGVNIRPYARELLKELSKVCEIIVFTASHECYANVVLDNLDPKGEWVAHRLFRGQCWQSEEGVYIKDLRVLKNRKLENVLLVDNAAYSYFNQLENGIPIIPYYDDKDDQELLHLIHYVQELIAINDAQEGSSLRELNHKYFQLSSYLHYEDIDSLTSTLYKETIVRHKQLLL
jgi:CTD small phosphatase-like protein 2